MGIFLRFLLLTAFAFCCCLYACDGKKNYRNPADWPSYLGDDARTHYSPLREIGKHNVAKLKVAWTYHCGGADTLRNTTQIQCNPLAIGGVLYGAAPDVQVFALDAATGQERWKFNTFAWLGGENSWAGTSRGLVFWRDKKEQRLFISAGSFLIALDPATGKPIETFGDGGKIDLRKDLDYDKEDFFIVANTPGVVYQDMIIMGARVSEGADAAPGHIRAFDVRTGKRRWIFHTIPTPYEYGHETWEDPDAWRRIGGANCWAGMTLDQARGIVFVPTGSASFDFWGGNRKGKNLFANCLIALDAATGKRIWHQQLTHHDIWDRDLPCPPTLATVNLGTFKKAKMVDVVAQPTKQGLLYIFDRETGKPIFRIEERPSPQEGAMPGEAPWPTQPVPVKPKPFAQQSMTLADINPYSTQRDSLLAILKGMRLEPNSPPSREGSLVLPGFDGGAEWGGAATDKKGVLYVNASNMPWILKMVDIPPDEGTVFSKGQLLYARHCTGCHGLDRRGNGANPNLIGLQNRRTEAYVANIIKQGRGGMAAFGHLGETERAAIVAYVMEQKNAKDKDNYALAVLEGGVPYVNTGYIRLQDKERLPAIKPPWGTLNAIDLATGEYRWSVTLGEDPALKKRGITAETGTENYGGPAVTAGGLVFIAASKDETIRAFDKDTGKLLWQAPLPASGFATPAIYAAGGKQFIVVACGGGKLGRRSGDAYVAFSL